MLDQSFSSDNFFRIFGIENRKGTFERHLLSKEYLDIHEKVKTLFSIKKSIAKDDFDIQLEKLNNQKDEALQKYLQEISERCNSKSFLFKLHHFEKDGKDIYTIKKDSASFFAMKQLQYNIFKTFKVKQANRYDIVKQLRILLSDGFPKYFIRIDLKGFYESIPQDILMKKVDENQLLNYQSKKLLKTLVYSYETIKDSSIYKKGHGIPRGLGVSAYLAELYMRDIDGEMNLIPDLVYYARYVDDVVFVFIPKSKERLGEYYNSIEKIIKNHRLSLKDGSDGGSNKTLQINLFQPSLNTEFDFLGYKFVINGSKLKELRLSDNKLKKYDDRLKSIIDDYNLNSKFDEMKARKLLFIRFKFLTGNFHLLNNKKRIKSGIYYSNILIKDNDSKFGEFKHLNNLIKKHLVKLKPHGGLRVDIAKLKLKIINRFSFQKGFYNRKERFHSFDNDQMREIVAVWKK